MVKILWCCKHDFLLDLKLPQIDCISCNSPKMVRRRPDDATVSGWLDHHQRGVVATTQINHSINFSHMPLVMNPHEGRKNNHHNLKLPGNKDKTKGLFTHSISYFLCESPLL